MEDEGDEPEFRQQHDNGELKSCNYLFEPVTAETASGVSVWGHQSLAEIALDLADARSMELENVSRRYGTLQLRKLSDSRKWCYHSILGVYSALE
jgi:hypothetical protein